ncbi:MAG: sialate O-acetylesterase [Qipengyuania sp.]
MGKTLLYARESVAFDHVITLRDTNGDPVDVTGWTFAIDFQRQAGTIDFSLETVNSSSAEGIEVLAGGAGELRFRISRGTLGGIGDTTGDFTLFGDLLGTPAGSTEPTFVADVRLNITMAGTDFAGSSYRLLVDAIGPAAIAEITAAATVAAETASAAAIAALAGGALPVYTTLAAAHAAVTTGDDFILVTAGKSFQRRQRTASGSDVIFSFYGQPAGFVPYDLGGTTVSLPYYSAVVDVFGHDGQSNGLGAGGTDSGSPATTQFEVEHDGTIITLDDTMSGGLAQGVAAGTGSMWPQFANEWATHTSRNSAHLQMAKGGSGLLAAAAPSSNWSSTGALRADALAKLQAAIDAVSSSPNLVLGNIYVTWTQGEQDAQQLYAGTSGVSGANYQAELEALIDYFQANIPTLAGFFIVRLGTRNNRAEAGAWAEIRQAQEAAAAANPIARIVSRASTSFPADGYNYMADQLHWNQTALNLNGKIAATEAAKPIASPAPVAPVALAKNSVVDTDLTAATSSTYSHTTDDGAKAIIVAVGGGKQTSSSTGTTTGVTFNGVAMTQLPNSPQSGSTGTTNTSANGRAAVSMWRLTETQYGAPLGGVTGDVVVTRDNSTNIISFAIYDLDCEPVLEATAFKARTAGSEAAAYKCGYTAAVDDGLTTGAPCFVIGVICDVGDGAAALTHSWTGLTEDYDGGASNGSRSAQFSAASATFTSDMTQKNITCTSSAISGGGLIVAAFRRRAGGE